MFHAKLISINNETHYTLYNEDHHEFFDEVEITLNGESIDIIEVEPSYEPEPYDEAVEAAGYTPFEWLEDHL